jgi:hypothetical protein
MEIIPTWRRSPCQESFGYIFNEFRKIGRLRKRSPALATRRSEQALGRLSRRRLGGSSLGSSKPLLRLNLATLNQPLSVVLFRRRLLFVFRGGEALSFLAAGCAFPDVRSALAVSHKAAQSPTTDAIAME